MKVSVIVPVYNAERYLERCLKHLVAQTHSDLEIILVNDGSTDSSREICETYAEKYNNIKVINQENSGSGVARNTGLSCATGEYVSFVDCDDWVAEDTYQYMLSLIEHNDAEIADVCCIQVNGEGEQVNNPVEQVEVLEGNDILYHYLYRGLHEQNSAPYSVCRKLFKKSFFDEISFSAIKVNEDICLNYKILQNCKKIAVSNQIKYFYYQNPDSKSLGMLKARDLDLIKVTDELIELAKESNDEKIIELAKIKRARSDFSLLARAAVAGKADDVDEETLKKLVSGLRKNLPTLLKSPMPLNRKALCMAFSVSYKGSTLAIKALKSFI